MSGRAFWSKVQDNAKHALPLTISDEFFSGKEKYGKEKYSLSPIREASFEIGRNPIQKILRPMNISQMKLGSLAIECKAKLGPRLEGISIFLKFSININDVPL